MKRRTLLNLFVNGMGALIGAVVAIPALVTGLSPALRRERAERWQPVGPLDRFEIGSVTLARVEVPRTDWSASLREKGVYVYRPREDEIVVYSRNCTDLSCPVTWDAGSRWFFCPCHGGIFDVAGEPQAGPPKYPLFRYAQRLRDGVVEIDLDSLPSVA